LLASFGIYQHVRNQQHKAFDCHFPSDISNLIKSYIYIPKKFKGEIVQRKTIPLVRFLVPLPVGELAFGSDRTVHYWSRDLMEISKRSFEDTIIHMVHLHAKVVVIAFRFHLVFMDLEDGPRGKVLVQMLIRVPPEPEPDALPVDTNAFRHIEQSSRAPTRFDLPARKPPISVRRVLPLLDGRLAVALNTGFVQVFTRRAGESWWSRRPHRWVTFDTEIEDMMGFEQLECGTVVAHNYAERGGMAYYDCVKWQRMNFQGVPSQTQALLKISLSRLVSFNRHGFSCWSVPAQRRVGGRFVSYLEVYEPLALWHDNMLICGTRFHHKLALVHVMDFFDDSEKHEFPLEREMVCAMMDRLGRFLVCTDRDLLIME